MIATRRLAIAASVFVLLASGCGLGENLVEQGIENAVEEGTEQLIEEGSGGDIDIDVDGGASVPDTFPSGVPLPEGELYYTVTVDNGWQLSYTMESQEAAEAFAQQFKDDPAYAIESESDYGEMVILILAGPEYRVSLTMVYPEGEPVQLSYVVSNI